MGHYLIEEKVDKIDQNEDLGFSASTAMESDYNHISSPNNGEEIDQDQKA